MRQVLFIISLCLCFPLFAQTSSSQSETDFLNIKKKYLAEQAGLTSKEADAFFPLYFEYQKLKKENNAKVWDNAKEISQNKQATEADYEKAIYEFIETEKMNTAIEEEYMKKGLEIIPASKIFKVLRAEIRFNRNILKNMKKPNNKK